MLDDANRLDNGKKVMQEIIERHFRSVSAFPCSRYVYYNFRCIDASIGCFYSFAQFPRLNDQQSNSRDRWHELVLLANSEKDPGKLIEIYEEMREYLGLGNQADKGRSDKSSE